jgi:hypothetical protein
MKKFLLYIFLFTCSLSVVHAQEVQEDAGKKEQRMKALYVAYVTQQLSLTEAEAQKFWPVHAQFESEMKAVNIDLPELERQQATLNIKKKYQDRFTSILGSPGRSNNFYKIDEGFRRKLIDEIRKRRQQNGLNQRPGKRRNF